MKTNWHGVLEFCLCNFVLVFLASCSSLNFFVSEGVPFKISANAKSEKTVSAEGTSDFYFWGMLPRHADIDLEEKTHYLGVNLPSYVSVEQSIGWKSFMYTVATLGLYCPVDYKITVLTALTGLETLR